MIPQINYPMMIAFLLFALLCLTVYQQIKEGNLKFGIKINKSKKGLKQKAEFKLTAKEVTTNVKGSMVEATVVQFDQNFKKGTNAKERTKIAYSALLAFIEGIAQATESSFTEVLETAIEYEQQNREKRKNHKQIIDDCEDQIYNDYFGGKNK